MDIARRKPISHSQQPPIHHSAIRVARPRNTFTTSAQKSDPIETFDQYIKRTHIKENTDKKPVKKIGRTIFWIAFFVFISSIIIALYLLYAKTNSTFTDMSDSTEKHSIFTTFSNITNSHSYDSLAGFTEGRINILLLGRANSHKSGKDLTDTIMLASINTTDYTVGLFSLPRDLLVAHGNSYGKINALYQSGLRNNAGADYIIDTVQDVTGQKIHYYVVMDFEGFIKIIDILDGINVDVQSHIKDERYPGPGYSYETFEVYPGLQKFNGEIALKYARTRHDAEGDFGRAKRQQQILQASRNKAFSLGTIVNPIKISEIFDVLGEHVHTNVSPNEIEPFIALFKKLDTQNITTVVVDAWQPRSLLVSARQFSDGVRISGLLPRIGNYKEIRDRAENIFNLNKIAQREKDIQNEQPTITLVNTTDDFQIIQRITTTLHSIGFEDITIYTPPQKNKNQISTREQSIIIDTTNGAMPFSLDELLKKIPLEKSDENAAILTDVHSDLVIMIGNNMKEHYTYTEISQDEMERDNNNILNAEPQL